MRVGNEYDELVFLFLFFKIFRVRQRCSARAEFCRWHYGSHTPGAGVKSLVFEAFLVRDVFSVHR